MDHPKMRETLRYSKAEKYFSTGPFWRAVSDSERREIFDDVKKAKTKRDSELKQKIRDRNIAALGDILDGIDEISYNTTWAQAQRVLIENAEFAKDVILQGIFLLTFLGRFNE
jgi:pre-mRNA-processing factor 40